MNSTHKFSIGIAVAIVAVVGLFISSKGADRNGDDGRGTPYVLVKSDNICGISDPRSLSSPARVNYPKVFSATPQVRKMKKENVKPDSAEGIILTSQAEALLRDLCLDIQEKQVYCSVWKRIRRRDGKPIPDVTRTVLEAIRTVGA